MLRLDGEIDLYVSHEIRGAAADGGAAAPATGRRSLAVTYIDSSGLSVLISAVNVEEYGGRLMLSGVQEPVRLIIETSGLSQFSLLFRTSTYRSPADVPRRQRPLA